MQAQQETNYLRIRVTSRLSLDVDIVLRRALNGLGDLIGVVWADNGAGRNRDIEVVRLDPSSLVERSIGVCDTASAAVADGFEASSQRSAGSVAHDCGRSMDISCNRRKGL